MKTEYIIALISVGIVALIATHVLAFLLGTLHEMKHQRRILERKTSWTSITASQAHFNVDFFDSLYQNNDARLTKNSQVQS